MENLQSVNETGPTDRLVNETLVADCMKCDGERAIYRLWQAIESGCVNEHWSIRCPDCGFEDDDTMPKKGR